MAQRLTNKCMLQHHSFQMKSGPSLALAVHRSLDNESQHSGQLGLQLEMGSTGDGFDAEQRETMTTGSLRQRFDILRRSLANVGGRLVSV